MNSSVKMHDIPKLTHQAHLSEEYDPNLYAYDVIDTGMSLDSLNETVFIEMFLRQGYVSIYDFFSKDRITAALEAMVEMIRGDNPHYDVAKFMILEAKGDTRTQWRTMPLDKREDIVRRLKGFAEHDPRLGGLMNDANLLHFVSLLMDGAVPALFQQMALIKPPRIGREKPWHQDHAYFRVPLDVPIVGCWIALDAASVQNGCMHVLPSEQGIDPIVHHNVRDWQICDAAVIGRPCTALPLPPGGVLFFSSLIPHGTPTNHSNQRRRAVQFHYAPTGHPAMDAETHKALFGDEAGDVPC